LNAGDVIAALDLPAGSRVDQRVPKKLLVEYGAPTAADRRRINEGVDEVLWLAALKPTTIGVALFRDEVREYLEIAVLSAVLRVDAKAERLAELIHRAVPYPVFLIATQGGSLALSLAHKRRSQGEAGATVLDGELVTAVLEECEPKGFGQAFRESLGLARQPRIHLYALYQGWMNALLALLSARVTGRFSISESPERAAARQEALSECARLDAEIARLRAVAGKERQVARRVELNLQLKRVEEQRSAARQRL
jgi:hypothetical protein